MIEDSILKKIIFDDERKYSHYHKRLKIRDDLYSHAYADRELLMKFITTFFPSEPSEIQEYRKETLSEITSTYYSKIMNTISRIRNSKSFNVDYADETIENHFYNINNTEKDIIDYFFDYLLKSCITDANSFIFVVNNEILWYDTASVLYYDDENVLIRISETEYYLYDLSGRTIIKRIKDDEHEDRFEVYDDFQFTFENEKKYWFKSGGYVRYVCHLTNDVIYESIIQSIAVFWKDAIIQYSDKQAGVKEHLFPLFWTTESTNCPRCKGTGMCEYQDEQYNIRSATCSDCAGTGKIAKGMFSQLIVKSDMYTEKMPIPPAGYISKDFTAIEFLNRDYKENIYAGLAAINFEHLFDVPLSQSGVAKEIDRKEMYSTLSKILNWSISILNTIYEISTYFYAENNNIYNYEEITPFLIATKSLNIDEDNIDETSISKNVVAQKQKINEYIDYNIVDDDKRKIGKLINELDNYSTLSTQEKVTLFEKGIISEIDLFVNMHLEKLIKEIYYSDATFESDSYETKTNKIISHATQKKGQN